MNGRLEAVVEGRLSYVPSTVRNKQHNTKWFEALTDMKMAVFVFWSVTPCIPVGRS
jgi:hypothetical protein